MVTLRMLAIAAALLVGLPLGWGLADHSIDHVVVQGGEVANVAIGTAAEVTDIVLLDTFVQYDRIVVHNAPEQLVEGHTVFLTLDTQLVPNVTNWTVDIIGSVECDAHVNGEGSFFQGLPIIPRRINDAYVECNIMGTVFVTPDPFYDSNDTTSSSSSSSTSPEPTGDEIPFVAPNGVRGVAREYSYFWIVEDAAGVQTATQRYAWSVPIIEPWVHTDGSVKRWYCPLPVPRLQEMGLSHFSAYVAESPDDLVFAMK